MAEICLSLPCSGVYFKWTKSRSEYVDEKEKGGYAFIEKYRLHEFFEDLQIYVYKPAKKEGLSNKELTKRLNHAFALIWAAAMLMKTENRKGDRITHWDFRDIRKIYEDPHAADLFLNRISKVKKPKAINPQDVRDDFRDAREFLTFKRDSQQPRRLIETAIQALRNIDHKSSFFHEETVKDAVKELDNEITKIKKDLGLQKS